MRPVKFRVWDELLSEMFYEGFTLTENGMVIKCGWYLRREKERQKMQDEAMTANNGKYCEPKYPQGLVVLQSTGTKCKNKEELYIDDIVLWNGKKYVIVWNKTCLGVYLEYLNSYLARQKDPKLGKFVVNLMDGRAVYLEVIGNVHKNIRLFEKKK